MTQNRSIARIMMVGLGCVALLAACGEGDGDSSASPGSAESGSTTTGDGPGDDPTTGGVTTSAGSTTTTSGPDEPGDTTQDVTSGTTGTSGTSEASDTTGTSGTGEPEESTGDTETSGTGEPVDTTEGTMSSTTADDETGDGTCDDLAALQAIAEEKGGQELCPGWTGLMNLEGPCPGAGPGWHVEKVFPGSVGQLGKYCYYQWIDGLDSEWDLCGLPADGMRSSSQWLGPDCYI